MLAQKVPVLSDRDIPAVEESDVDSLVHDLRGPLSVIVAFAESIDGASREERARFVARLVANAHRALSVLEEFAALCDLRAGEVETCLRPMDLAEVARQATEATAEASRHGSDLAAVVPDDGVSVIGDRDLIGMALRSVLRRTVPELAGSAPLRVQVAGDGDFATVELRAAPSWRDRTRFEADAFEILQRVVALHGGRTMFDRADPYLVFRLSIPLQAQ